MTRVIVFGLLLWSTVATADVPNGTGYKGPISLSIVGPNPYRGGAVFVQVLTGGATRIDALVLVDLRGRQLARRDLDLTMTGGTTFELPVGSLTSGVYFVAATSHHAILAANRLVVVR